MTWPVVARIGTELAGGRSDLRIHQWTFWWVKEALLNGQSPFYTRLLYYPEGVSLTSHNIAWFNIALWIPLQALIGSIAAYNVIFLAILAMNGFATYLFVRELVGSETAAFIAGLIVGFWPYTLSHYDHPNMIVVFWVPLTLLYFRRTVKRPRWRTALLAAFFLAMIGISRWQLLLMSAPILIAYWLYLTFSEPQGRTWRTIKYWLGIGLVAGALTIPLALPLIIDQVTSDHPEDIFMDEPDRGRTDLFAYVIRPDYYDAFWDEVLLGNPILSRPYHHISASTYYVPFLGYTALILAFIGALGKRRRTWLWLSLVLLYALFALGPELAVNGRVLPQVTLPYYYVEDWLVFGVIRRPHRLNLFLSLPLALMAAWGVKYLLASRQRWQEVAITGLFALVVLLEYNPTPFATTTLQVPAWHQQLANEPGAFGILDVPINDRSFDKWYMLYQTVHGKPLATGHVSRMPQEAFDFLRGIPFLEPVLNQERDLNWEITNVSHQLRLLAEGNIRYLVVHKQYKAEGVLARWKDWFTIPPHYEDEEVIVYRTDPRLGEDFTVQQWLTDEIGFMQSGFAPHDAVQQGVIKIDIRWGSRGAPDGNNDVCFELVNTADLPVDSHCVPVSETWPTSQWQGNEVVRESYVLPVPADLEPGDYKLQIRLVDAASGTAVSKPFDFGAVTVYAFDPTEPASTTWAGQVRLRGYRLKSQNEVLVMTLYWQGQADIVQSYKFFAHVINTETGEVVAQADAVPRNWNYPTYAWEPGEIIRETITLLLDTAPSGEHEIWLGWYDQETGERLPLTVTGNHTTRNRAILLTTVKH